MSEGRSDFERLIGPDRRKVPLPKGLGAVVSGISAILLIGMVLLWPRGDLDLDLGAIGFADDVVGAEVLSVTPQGCSYAEDLPCNLVELGVEGEERIVTLEFPDELGQPDLAVGDQLTLSVIRYDDGTIDYQYADRQRGPLVAGLALVFAVAVVLLGRVRGLAALFGLAVSIAVLIAFILPAIVAGRDAVLVALVGGGVIALVTLYLAHGLRPLTHAAALGAFAALVLTTGLSWLVVALARFSGLVSEEAFFLLALPNLDLDGLLLAGVVLGAIGALDDVTVTQASAVWEVHAANPDLGHAELYASGLRVGRDHIVSTVNTLLLAYAGASLPLLILFTLAAQPFAVVASSEVVATEIVRTLVGSIGLVSAVPMTTWLAARIASGRGDAAGHA